MKKAAWSWNLATPDEDFLASTPSRYGSDYDEAQLAEIMCGSDLVGDIVDNWLRNGQDLPTVAFCVNKAHANFVTMQFNKAGVNAEVMVAETPHEERQLMIHRFDNGDFNDMLMNGDQVRELVFTKKQQVAA